MFENLKSYFEHNRNERNGAVAILFIMLIIFVGSELYSRLYRPPIIDQSALNAKLAAFHLADTVKRKEDISQPQLFSFDPNTLNDSGFSALGFSEKEIGILRKYMAAGAGFRIKSDFQKLYFVDSTEFVRLAPFIELPEALEKENYKIKKDYKPNWGNQNSQNVSSGVKWSDTADTRSFSHEVKRLNLNFTDTTELKKLPGIGSFYAKKIVAYRQELGGYFSLSQLLELWGMTPEKIDVFADRVRIDQKDIRKIYINKATAQELSAHPYISFQLASQLISKRETAGKFNSMTDVCGQGLLDADLCAKLAPYIDFR